MKGHLLFAFGLADMNIRVRANKNDTRVLVYIYISGSCVNGFS